MQGNSVHHGLDSKRGNIMNTNRTASTRLRALFVMLGAVGLLTAACATETPAATETASFVSNLTGLVHMDVFVPADMDAVPPRPEDSTIPVDIDLSGTAMGKWVKSGSGKFNASLSLEGGEFDLEAPGVGTVTVSYSVNSPATAAGAFKPSTGVGGFTTSAVLTVDQVSIPTGDPENPFVLDFTETTCDVGLDMDVAGAIDASSGMLSVSQDSFHVDVPADDDCNTFGEVIADLLGGPDNSVTLGFWVQPAA